jgi:hypothetical protein
MVKNSHQSTRAMVLFCFQAFLFHLTSCSQISHPSTETNKPQKNQGPSSGLKPDSVGGNTPGGQIGCTSVAIAGLNVGVLFSPGESPSGKVKLVKGGDVEEITLGTEATAHLSRGVRIKGADGKIRPWYSSWASGATESPGVYKVIVEAFGKEYAKDNVVVQKDECHVKTETVYVEVGSPTARPLDDTKDYYPLDNGRVFELDPKTGTGKLQGQGTVHTDIEIVRVLHYTETQGNGPSSSVTRRSEEERKPTGKVKLGTFLEQNIDRGPLPPGAVNDDGERVLYVKE